MTPSGLDDPSGFDKNAHSIYTYARPARRSTTVDKAEIQEKLIDILSKHTSIDRASVTPEKHLKFDLGLDSLDVAEMVYEIEETFGITISDDSAEKIQKISDTVDFIHEHLHVNQDDTLAPREAGA
jgi:acyl carrier protein